MYKNNSNVSSILLSFHFKKSIISTITFPFFKMEICSNEEKYNNVCNCTRMSNRTIALNNEKLHKKKECPNI